MPPFPHAAINRYLSCDWILSTLLVCINSFVHILGVMTRKRLGRRLHHSSAHSHHSQSLAATNLGVVPDFHLPRPITPFNRMDQIHCIGRLNQWPIRQREVGGLRPTDGARLDLDIQMSTVRMDPRTGSLRAPVKSAWGRGRNYERVLDRSVLFYDIYREPDRDTALAVGPALPRHLPGGEGISFACAETGRPCRAKWLPGPDVHGDWFRITLPPGTTALAVSLDGQQHIRAVQPNLSARLAGRRVLLTRSHNDDLEWIADRAWFHAYHHGFDAIVVYDNDSSDYAREDVAAALRVVPGIDIVVTVDWPFGMYPPAAPGWPNYDEVWGEAAIINHAIRRLLWHSDAVFWGDIDELLIRRGKQSLDDVLAEPDHLWMLLNSQDVVAIGDVPDRRVRHRDFHWTQGEATVNRCKWIVRPGRMKKSDRLGQHYASWRGRYMMPPELFSLAHFFPITSGWGRREGRGVPASPVAGLHREDDLLRRQMDEAFSQWHSNPEILNSDTTTDAIGVAAEGWQRLAAGDPDGALRYFERSLTINPHQPTISAERMRLIGARENMA